MYPGVMVNYRMWTFDYANKGEAGAARTIDRPMVYTHMS